MRCNLKNCSLNGYNERFTETTAWNRSRGGKLGVILNREYSIDRSFEYDGHKVINLFVY